VTSSERTIILDIDDLEEIDDWGNTPEWATTYGPSQGLIYRAFHAIYEGRPPERPLREGDRVKVGNTTATVCSTTDGGVKVDWDSSYPVLKTWLPVEAVTRIDEGDEQ